MKPGEVHDNFHGWVIYSDGMMRFKDSMNIFTWGEDLELEGIAEDLLYMIELKKFYYPPALLPLAIEEAKRIRKEWTETLK